MTTENEYWKKEFEGQEQDFVKDLTQLLHGSTSYTRCSGAEGLAAHLVHYAIYGWVASSNPQRSQFSEAWPKAITAFGQVLKNDSDPSVRKCVVKSLGDMCSRIDYEVRSISNAEALQARILKRGAFRDAFVLVRDALRNDRDEIVRDQAVWSLRDCLTKDERLDSANSQRKELIETLEHAEAYDKSSNVRYQATSVLNSFGR